MYLSLLQRKHELCGSRKKWISQSLCFPQAWTMTLELLDLSATRYKSFVYLLLFIFTFYTHCNCKIEKKLTLGGSPGTPTGPCEGTTGDNFAACLDGRDKHLFQ